MIIITYVLLRILVRLQHLEDDELGEGVEAADEVVLLEHLREHAEHQGPGCALRVVQVLQQHSEHRAEVLDQDLEAEVNIL